MKSKITCMAVVAVTGLLAAGATAQNVWKGAGTNDWHGSTDNWSQGHFPQAGEDVIITNANAGVVLSSAAPVSGWLSSLVISNKATLIFTNWDTTLSATNITIATNGLITLPAAFTAEQMSNNIYLICSDLTVQAGGNIDANARGYVCGSDKSGDGPGGACYGGAGQHGKGASYGGLGGGSWAVSTNYGSASMPLAPGSAGSQDDSYLKDLGGSGGGAVRIAATGAVTVNGAVTANGGDTPSRGGGGSGGGIYIVCNTFAGAGAVQARGGSTPSIWAGNGGGGRIAVQYAPASQKLLAPPTVRFSVLPGNGAVYDSSIYQGDAGTLYFPDSALFPSLFNNFQGHIYGVTNWATDSLTVSNVSVGFNEEGFRLTVTNNLVLVGPTCKMELGGSVFTNMYWSDPTDLRVFRFSQTQPSALLVGRDLILTNSAQLYLYSARTNGVAPDYGALVSVTGDVVIAPNCWILPYSHPTNGGSALFRMSNLTIAASALTTNAGINADGKGFRAGKPNAKGFGPGAGINNSNAGAQGGGYGGLGGKFVAPWGRVYGRAEAPLDPGSGGGGADYSYGQGGAGGGLVRIEALGIVTVNGSITANGELGGQRSVGGGSGGGIYIVCKNLAGEYGVITAIGGKGDRDGTVGGGGGGGGRIAVIYTNAAGQVPLPGLTFSAGIQASAYNGDLGTLYFPDTRLLTETIPHSGVWVLPAFSNLVLNSLTISNGALRFAAEGFRLTISNDLTVLGPSGRLELGGNAFTNSQGYVRLTYSDMTSGPALTVGRNLTLTNGGTLMICAGRTNGAPGERGARVSVGGTVSLASNAWIYPVSHPTNGGSAVFRVGALAITATNSGFNANYAGYLGGKINQAGWGPGYGAGDGSSGGGGYGGKGGQTVGGSTYGSSNAPVNAGSGGGGGDYQDAHGGMGGGVIEIDCARTFALGGVLSANGYYGTARAGSGGAGGSVYVRCRKFSGSGASVIQANGGDSDAPGEWWSTGGGGGGRIAIWRVSDGSSGVVTPQVNGGIGYIGASSGGTLPKDGGTGTIVWGLLAAPGTVFMLR